MAGLADTVSRALGVNPDAGVERVVAPDVQQKRDQVRLGMLRNERAQETDPRITSALDTEISATQRNLPTAPADSSSGFSAAPVIAALGTRPPAEAAAPAPARGHGFMGGDPDASGAGALAAGETALHIASGIGKSIVGGWRGLAALASGAGLDEAARQVESPELAGGLTARSYTPSDEVAKVASEANDSPKNPLNLPGVLAGKAGQATLEATGSPAAATAVETGLNAVPLLLLKGGKSTPARAGERVVGSGSIAEAPKATPSGQPAALTEAERLEIPTVMRRQPQPVGAPREPLTLVPAEKTPGRTGNPAFDRAEPPGPGPTPVEAPKFAESAPSAEGGLPLAQQGKRAEVLQRIGLNEVRESAVKGDGKAAATDYQVSKLDTPEGRYMKGLLDREREALTAHADRIIQDTGGTPGVDAHALEARGHTILAPLEAFKQWFTDKTTGLYNEARARAQGAPLALERTQGLLGTDSAFSSTDTINLRKGVQARMRELGMMDKDGNVMPATVDQAEALRQYVNEQWTPQANGTIKKLKNALDEDVTASAGEDIYKQARALHAMKATIFDDPKGISSIMDSEGINRKVPVEKVADSITALPYAQFDHIVKTLETVPPELRPQAQAALSEIKAQFANRLTDQARAREGQWGAKDVSRFLNQNGKKLARVFSPEEMQAITDLNDAGHILRRDQSYPGAAVQGHNLVKRGAMAAAQSVGAGAGAVVGAAVGAPGTGASVGSAIAQAVTKRFDESAALKAAQKRTVKLSEFPK